MPIKTLYKTVNDNGEYSCGDIGISKNEWLQLLKNSEAEQYRDALFCFLRMPDNAGTCSAVAQKFGGSPQHYNAKIMNFAKWVQMKLNRFQIIATDGEPTYWCIPMERGYETWLGFKWQLRSELVEALQFYLLKALELSFRSKKSINGFDEEYKWELLDKTEGKSILDMTTSLAGINLVDNIRVDNILKFLRENNPDELTAIGDHLFDESKPIDDRITAYKNEMRTLVPDNFKNCANDERTASALLTCKFPERYTFYKDEVYQVICQYFGFENRKPGKKFSHFIEIINRFTAELGEKIQQDMLPEISQFKNKPLNLAVQTLFWCMKDYMKEILDRKPQKEEVIIDPINEEDMPQQKYKEFIELLREAHNLVLTGAPGTGKTRMAKEIAMEMGAEIQFVQFHPSYDYTDFVEGLRPVDKGDDQMGFERRNGVFKEFCKAAAKNIEDSQKSQKELKEEKTLEEKYNELVEKIENGEIQEIPLKTEGKSMTVVRISGNNNIILRTFGNTDGREYTVSFDRLAKLAKVYPDIESLNAITNIYKAVTAAILGCHSSSYWAVLNEVYKQGTPASTDEPTSIPKKPFVFIIDEINRGEASKIFGELFFAIDPGYRGNTDILVQTQYQNLVPETDVFAKGFYVPENVYILATMNDIDRSVESMDFAMRRRFTWKEITPDDTESMLDDMLCAKEAKETMHRLNSAIAESDGLGSAYMIGPAYFLKLKDNGGDFDKLWKMNIQPLLKEYLRGFRKTDEILEKFSKAYFDNNDTADEDPLLDDED